MLKAKAASPRWILVLASTLGVCLLVPSGARSQDPGDRKKQKRCVVVVPPFENQTKYHHEVLYDVAIGNDPSGDKKQILVDRLTEAPRSVLEDMLGGINGVTIIERQPVDALLVESEYGGLRGLADAEKAEKLGKKLSATTIVMGTITDLHDDVAGFAGYGVRSEVIKVMCQIRIRLLDIDTGKVKFSKIIKGSKTYNRSNFGGKVSSDRHFEAVEATLAALKKDPQFEAALLGRKPSSSTRATTADDDDGVVEVEFAPKPENCDIEINGKYVGGSPVKRRLPAGKEVKIRISKDGYKVWEGVIVPEKGLRITRELGPER
jgi:curli biogenesis system outer membrane secretion channel CsgG